MNHKINRSFWLLALLLLSAALLIGCGATPSPTTVPVVPTDTPTAVPSSPTPEGTPTPSTLGITFIAQYDPTTNILTIFGTTPGATIVVGGTPIKPPPTNTPTQTPIPTQTLPPTVTPTRPYIPPPPTRNLGINANRDALAGKILFKTDRDGGGTFGNVFSWYVMNPDGSGLQKVEPTSATALYQAIRSREGYSPDGQRIVISDRPYATGVLYILDTVLDARLLASGDSPSHGEWINKSAFKLKSPVWSPAANYIVFVSNHEVPSGQGCVRTTANIFKATPTQNPTIRRLTSFCAGADADHPSFRGDGSQVAFWGGETGRRQIYVVDVGADDSFDASVSNPHVISGGNANDWDPLWIK